MTLRRPFRDFSTVTLMNVFQFGIKERLVEATGDKWRDGVIAPFEASLPKS